MIPTQDSASSSAVVAPKYTIKILTPLEPYIRCEDEWGAFMESPKRSNSDVDMDSPKRELETDPEMKSPQAEYEIYDDSISPIDNPMHQEYSEAPILASYENSVPVEASSGLPPEKQLCRTRQDRKFVECRYGDRCRFSHDCPRCPGLSHAAFHCPKPLYTIRILGPMVPTPRPSPGDTPAFDPLSPYNSSSFLMSSESHPTRELTNESFDFPDWDYGSMDNVPCEYLYGAWMQSPAHGPRPAPQDLLDEEDSILTSEVGAQLL